MKTILSSAKHHYVPIVSIFLIMLTMVTLIAGMAGCGGGPIRMTSIPRLSVISIGQARQPIMGRVGTRLGLLTTHLPGLSMETIRR